MHALKARGAQIIDLPQQDFSDTAALIEQLDLVVSVDTSVAHCAGALGKRTWLQLPFASADWRWLLERTDNPWYPSFKLYRQAQMGDWSEPLVRLSADLHSWARTSTSPHSLGTSRRGQERHHAASAPDWRWR